MDKEGNPTDEKGYNRFFYVQGAKLSYRMLIEYTEGAQTKILVGTGISYDKGKERLSVRITYDTDRFKYAINCWRYTR